MTRPNRGEWQVRIGKRGLAEGGWKLGGPRKEVVEGSGQRVGCRGWGHRMNNEGVPAGLRRVNETGAFCCHHPAKGRQGWS